MILIIISANPEEDNNEKAWSISRINSMSRACSILHMHVRKDCNIITELSLIKMKS